MSPKAKQVVEPFWRNDFNTFVNFNQTIRIADIESFGDGIPIQRKLSTVILLIILA